MPAPVMTSEVTHEDDNYLYGKTYVDGEFSSTFCIRKIGGKPKVVEPARLDELTPEQWAERVKRGRRQYVKTMKPDQAKAFIKRLIAEGYDMYGDTFEDILNA